MKKIGSKKNRHFYNISRRAKIFSVGTLLFFALANLFAIYKIQEIRTEYSVKQFKDPTHPLLDEDERVTAQFNIVEVMPLVVLLEARETWAAPEAVQLLHQITKTVGKFPDVADIRSLANVETAIASESTFTVGYIRDFIKDPVLQKKIVEDPLLAPHLISRDGRHAALIVKLDNVEFKRQEAVLTKIRSLLGKYSDHFTYHLGGPVAISVDMANLLSREIAVFSLIALLGSALVFFILFKSLRVIVLSLVIIATTNLVALACLVVFGLPLTVLSCTVPILVTLTVIAIVSHNFSILTEYSQGVVRRNKHLVVFHLNKNLFFSHWLATLTTLIGFSTLLWSNLPVIKNFAASVIIALIAATAIAMPLFTAGMVWIPIPQKRKWSLNPDYFSRKILAYDKFIFAAIVAVALTCALLGSYLNWSTRLFDDLPADHPARVATLTAEEKMGGVVPLDIAIGYPDKAQFWENSQNVQTLGELVESWRHKEFVGSVISLSDFMAASQQKRQLASSDKSISETLFIYSMSNENPLQNFITPNYQFARVSFRLKDVPSLKIQRLLSELRSEAQAVFPGSRVEFAGIGAVTHALNHSLSRDLIFGFNTAMFWIVILLVFVFRSLKWALVSIVPNLVSPALLLGALVFSQTPVKPGIAIIFSISLGIAFGNSIYILLELKRMLKKNPARGKLPLRALLNHELGPCFNSALAAMATFCIFLFSGLHMNVIFGTFMILSVLAGMCGDLLLLPATLSLFPKILAPSKYEEKFFKTLFGLFTFPAKK